MTVRSENFWVRSPLATFFSTYFLYKYLFYWILSVNSEDPIKDSRHIVRAFAIFDISDFLLKIFSQRVWDVTNCKIANDVTFEDFEKSNHFSKDNISILQVCIIVYFWLSGSRIWALIVKRVVYRFDWNFYTIIWHLYTFSFANWNFFWSTEFLWSSVKKKWGFFSKNLEMVNLYEFFYVMKVIGKILRGVFLIGIIVSFHFHPILEFSDSRFGRYWRIKKHLFLRNFANFTPKLKVKISKVGPKFSLKLQQLWKYTKRFFRKHTACKKIIKWNFDKPNWLPKSQK